MIGVGIVIALIFVALIAIGSSVIAKAKALDFAVSPLTVESVGNSTTYFYDIDFVNAGQSKYQVSSYNFKMVTEAGSVYNANPFTFSFQSNKAPISNTLPSVELEQNQHARGYIAFIIPNSEKPKELQYSDGSAIAITKPLD